MATANEFDVTEREAILAEYDQLAREPVRPNITSVGCVMSIVAAIILVVYPRFGRGLPPAVHIVVLLLVAFLAVGGILVYFFGGGGGYAHSSLRANNALELLSRSF